MLLSVALLVAGANAHHLAAAGARLLTVRRAYRPEDAEALAEVFREALSGTVAG